MTGWTGDRNYRDLALHDQAIQQSSVLIRPGIPGQRPFWNERSRRFMNVPTSDFKVVEGAGSYFFTATCSYSKAQHRFQSAKYLPEFSRYLASLGPASVGEPPRRPHAAVQTQAGALPGVDPKLPRVLIIGDSISIGYTAPVTRMLAGKANVRRIPGNGRFTAFGLEHLKDWLGNDKWDVIHFNWGIWDLHRPGNGSVRTTAEQYEKNLCNLVSQLKATGAQLIWASTTPLGPLPEGARNIPVNIEDVPAYNAAAMKVMRESGVRVDDLYSAVLPKAKELWGPDNRHFKLEGYDFLAAKVVGSIQAALAGVSAGRPRGAATIAR